MNGRRFHYRVPSCRAREGARHAITVPAAGAKKPPPGSYTGRRFVQDHPEHVSRRGRLVSRLLARRRRQQPLPHLPHFVPSKISCFLPPTSFTSTTIMSLPLNSPLSSSSVSGSSTKFSIARRSGRAPKSVFVPFLIRNFLASSLRFELQAPFAQPLADLAQLQIDDLLQVFDRQVAEDDHVVARG